MEAWRRSNTERRSSCESNRKNSGGVKAVALKLTRSDVREMGDFDEHTRECPDCDKFAALGRRDKQGLLALSAKDIEWIVPGNDCPLAGTHRGHAGLENLLQKANVTVETSYPEPPEFIAQGDRALVVGVATGKIKATNKPFEDHWVFDITVRNGKLTNIREYRHASTGAGLRDGREPQALTRRHRYHTSSLLPAAFTAGIFEQGERTGKFRLGRDDLTADDSGNSRILMEAMPSERWTKWRDLSTATNGSRLRIDNRHSSAWFARAEAVSAL
jgi:uncharacterized protein